MGQSLPYMMTWLLFSNIPEERCLGEKKKKKKRQHLALMMVSNISSKLHCGKSCHIFMSYSADPQRSGCSWKPSLWSLGGRFEILNLQQIRFILGWVEEKKSSWSYLIGHQGGDGPADFMILGAFSQRAEQDEEEPVQQTGQQVKLGRLWTTHTHTHTGNQTHMFCSCFILKILWEEAGFWVWYPKERQKKKSPINTTAI